MKNLNINVDVESFKERLNDKIQNCVKNLKQTKVKIGEEEFYVPQEEKAIEKELIEYNGNDLLQIIRLRKVIDLKRVTFFWCYINSKAEMVMVTDKGIFWCHNRKPIDQQTLITGVFVPVCK